MKTGEACIRTVVCIEPHAGIHEAARLMRQHHVGDLVIVDSGEDGKARPIGIVTDRDLVIEVLAMDLDLDRVNVVDLFCSPRLITVSVNEELETTLDIMWQHGIRRIPVLESDGSLAGILTVDDMVELLSEQLGLVTRLITRQLDIETRRRE